MKFITRGRRTNAPGSSTTAVDYSLADEWDDGAPLEGRDDLPVCITVSPISSGYLLDATLEEEEALGVSVNVLASSSGRLYGVRQRGKRGLEPSVLHESIQVGIRYAQQLAGTLKK